MSSKSDKDRLKAQQEKHQAILAQLLKDDDNKYCVDCDAKGKSGGFINIEKRVIPFFGATSNVPCFRIVVVSY